MKYSFRLATVLVSFAMCSAAEAAEKVKVTVSSDPVGATVYADTAERNSGYAPVVFEYEVPRGFFKGVECLKTQPMKVRWASGAEAAVAALQVCPANGKSQIITFVRPTSFPGQEADAFFALELQRFWNTVNRENAQAHERAVDEIVATIQRGFATARSRAPINCTSSVITGIYVYTTCQ